MPDSQSLLRSLLAALLLIGVLPLVDHAQQGTLTLRDAVNGGQVALSVTGHGYDEPIALRQSANKGAASLTRTVDAGENE